MAENYYDFLTDTSVFLEQIPPTKPRDSVHEAWGAIHQAIQAINSNVLDLGEEAPVSFALGVEQSRLKLGHLGDYAINTRVDHLSVVAERLQTLAPSNRFQRAIHGFWPA